MKGRVPCSCGTAAPSLLLHGSAPRASAAAALQAAVQGPQCAAGHPRRLHAHQHGSPVPGPRVSSAQPRARVSASGHRSEPVAGACLQRALQALQARLQVSCLRCPSLQLRSAALGSLARVCLGCKLPAQLARRLQARLRASTSLFSPSSFSESEEAHVLGRVQTLVQISSAWRVACRRRCRCAQHRRERDLVKAPPAVWLVRSQRLACREGPNSTRSSEEDVMS